jgi:hypothetical protein
MLRCQRYFSSALASPIPVLVIWSTFAGSGFWNKHHYIHHIDTRANTNFLLPLADLLMGTLRRQLSSAELMRWPSYAAARTRLFNPVSAAIREVSDLGPQVFEFVERYCCRGGATIEQTHCFLVMDLYSRSRPR